MFYLSFVVLLVASSVCSIVQSIQNEPSKESFPAKFENGIRHLNVTTKKLASSKEQSIIKFDAEFPWNENFHHKNSSERRVLIESFTKYFNDLLKRHRRDKMSVQIIGLKVAPADLSTVTHFKLIVECENIEKVSERQSAAWLIASNLSVNDLMRYYQEVGHSGEVNIEPHFQVDESDNDSAEYPPDDYNEDDYDVLDTNDAKNTSDISDTDDTLAPSDLIVNYVEKVTQNEFLVQAYIDNTSIDTHTEDFKQMFESYAEQVYDSFREFNDSSISVKLINSTEIENKNETMIWLFLKTTNIVVTDEDLRLGENSIFDEIFDYLYFYEFDGKLPEEETPKSNISDEHELLETEPASETIEPLSIETKAPSEDSEPAYKDTEPSSGDTEAASGDTEPEFEDTKSSYKDKIKASESIEPETEATSTESEEFYFVELSVSNSNIEFHSESELSTDTANNTTEVLMTKRVTTTTMSNGCTFSLNYRALLLFILVHVMK